MIDAADRPVALSVAADGRLAVQHPVCQEEDSGQRTGRGQQQKQLEQLSRQQRRQKRPAVRQRLQVRQGAALGQRGGDQPYAGQAGVLRFLQLRELLGPHAGLGHSGPPVAAAGRGARHQGGAPATRGQAGLQGGEGAADQGVAHHRLRHGSRLLHRIRHDQLCGTHGHLSGNVERLLCFKYYFYSYISARALFPSLFPSFLPPTKRIEQLLVMTLTHF